MKRFSNLKIGFKISIVTMLILVCSLAAVGFSSIYFSNSGIKGLTDEFLQNRAKDSAMILSERVSLIKKDLEQTASEKDLQLSNWETQKAALEAKTNTFDCLRIGIVDAGGKASYTDGSTEDLSGQTFYKNSLNSDTVISDPEYLKADDKVVFYGFSKIPGSDNRLAVQLNYATISDVIADIKVGENGYCFVDNNECTTVIHKDLDLVKVKDNDFISVKTDPNLQQIVDIEKKMVAGETGVGSYTYNGNKKYLGYAPVEGTNWSLAVAALDSEIFAPIHTIENILLLTAGIALAAGIGIQLLLTRSIINRPIKKIVDAATRLSSGDVDVTLVSNSRDEIGILSDAFQKIADGTKECAKAAELLAAGETDVSIIERSENDVLMKSMQSVKLTLNHLSDEFKMLIESSEQGDFSKRGDSGLFRGQYALMIQGVNKILGEVEKAFDQINAANHIIEKQSEYQKEQTGKIVVNLERLSRGELCCDMSVTPPDDDTQELYDLFSGISHNLHKSVSAIQGYIKDIDTVLNEVADGNLSVEIKSDYLGDFMKLKSSINQIIQSMNKTFLEINLSAEQVAAGSKQVSDGSQELSQGATRQASSIEQLNDSISRLADNTRKNASYANQANESSMIAKDAAINGNSEMKLMLGSMSEINEASINISKIIKVIDDIAFQTNILALNAAVEAARAGQHGKGFAVVAEEVRNLASRSANAAKETTVLIEGSISKVDSGTKIANNTADALEKIMSEVINASDLVSSISSATNVEAAELDQISKEIDQLSNVVQTNSATAQQSAAASEELFGQSEMMKEMVGKFRLRQDDLKPIED
jgi:methyl-accepting chemotaxis protein